MSRLSFALTIAVLFGALVVLSAFALRTLLVSGPGNEDQAEATQEMTQATETTEETTAYGEETTAYQEETTALEASTARPSTAAAGPPDSTLSYGGREVRVSVSASFCWGGGCFDGAPTTPPPKKTLTVPSGSEMVFRYGGQTPKKVSVEAASFDERGPFGEPTGSGGSLKAHGSGVERTIPAELPPGEYGVYVYVADPLGDPYYLFRVKVQ